MKKRMIPIMLIVVSFLTVMVSARANIGSPILSFSGTTAYCEIIVRSPGNNITVTLELWDGNTQVDSWSDSGSDEVIMSESCRVTSGERYTLKGHCTIDGTYYTLVPVSGTC